jgi:hypothetical protein
MNFFRINDDKTSYFFPILKLILAIIFIVLPIVISFNCHFNDRSLEVLTQIIGFCVLIWGFFNVYIVIGEFACVAENRKKSKLTDNFNKLKIYIFSFENICSLLLNNEICDIYIILNNKVVNIGCSSIYNKKNGKFSNKRYYINGKEYKDYATFEHIFANLIDKDMNSVKVLEIDGVSPKNYLM